jgi:hypothetical protein
MFGSSATASLNSRECSRQTLESVSDEEKLFSFHGMQTFSCSHSLVEQAYMPVLFIFCMTIRLVMGTSKFVGQKSLGNLEGF